MIVQQKEEKPFVDTRVKICGLRRPRDIEIVNEYKPDYVGFVFAVSKRQVSAESAKSLRKLLKEDIMAVGIFVNEEASRVSQLANEGIIDMIQLHGDEDEAYIARLKEMTNKPIIKAFSIRKKDDISRAKESSADYILLDSGSGGTGTAFDWTLVKDIGRDYFLAGGIDAKNVKDAVRRFHPFAVDISSGVETDGYKDRRKIDELMTAIRRVSK